MVNRIGALARSVVIWLSVAACGLPAVVPPSPHESAAAARSPSAVPSAPVVVEAEAIPPDSYARVVANEVPVRSRPGAPSDPTQPEGPLPIGLLVLVVDGPVQADGGDWYLVQPTYTPDMDQSYPFGWVPAMDTSGEPSIEFEPTECPPPPTDIEGLVQVRGMGELFFGITCFGGKELQFQARIGQLEGYCGDSWGVDPAWFACSEVAPYLAPLEQGADDELLIYPILAPEVDTSVMPHQDAAGPLPIVEVKGMFDHPAAQTCRNKKVLDMGDPEPDPAQTILLCRSQFVVTSMRTIGR